MLVTDAALRVLLLLEEEGRVLGFFVFSLMVVCPHW